MKNAEGSGVDGSGTPRFADPLAGGASSAPEKYPDFATVPAADFGDCKLASEINLLGCEGTFGGTGVSGRGTAAAIDNLGALWLWELSAAELLCTPQDLTFLLFLLLDDDGAGGSGGSGGAGLAGALFVEPLREELSISSMK